MIPNDSEFKLQILASIKGFASTLRGVRYQSSLEKVSHTAIVPWSTYSPWLDDQSFQKIFGVVSPNSLLDIYRMFQLWELTGQVCTKKCMQGDILEVGSWRGGSGCLIGAKCVSEGVDSQVYLADTFRGVPKAGEQDTLYRGGEHSDTSPHVVSELIGKLSLSNVEILQGLFPEHSSHSIATKRFRMCHIDVDAYQSGLDVFAWVWPRLETGGVVVFDDYGFWGCEGIARLVSELKYGDDRTFIHNLTGQAIIIKTADTTST